MRLGEAISKIARCADRAWGWAASTLLVAGVLCQVFIGEHRMFGDDLVRWVALDKWLRLGKVPDASFKYSLMMPLASAPFWYLDRVLKIAFFIDRFNTLVVTLGVVAFYFLLRRRVEMRLLGTFLLLFFFASMFPHHLVFYYGEVFSAVAVAVGVAAICTERPLFGWPLVVVGVVNTPALAVPMALICARHVWTTKRIRHLIPLFVAAALICGENAWRKGGPFVTGYNNDGVGPHRLLPYSGHPGFGYPLVFGVAAILFSFGRGIMFFAPGLWAARSARDVEAPDVREMLVLWLLFLGGTVLAYSRWWAWHGASFWGPRFFLFASIPAAYLIAIRITKADATLAENIFTFVLLAASFWVGISGIWFRWDDLPSAICGSGEGESCLFVPELSPLVNRIVFPKPLDARMIKMTFAPVAACLFLGAPLLIRIGKQTWHALAWLTQTTFSRKTWNF